MAFVKVAVSAGIKLVFLSSTNDNALELNPEKF